VTSNTEAHAIVWKFLATASMCATIACSSWQLPADTDSPPVEEVVRTAASQLDVGVETTRRLSGFNGSGRNGDFTAWLTSALQESGLFRRVAPIDEIQNPTLIARVDAEPPPGCYLAFIASFTFGIIPEPIQEPRGYAFSLRTSTSTQTSVTVDCRYEQTGWFGWVTGLRNISSNYSSDLPEETARFRRFVAAALRRKLPEVVAAAGSETQEMHK